ncbi:hypothetical protein ACQCN2_01250 [Brevibacillus ginsengisoli]|uniref:hypothetical protein n=1 Tax=Brevibacillus ginsengisoli TaxID=363854 RepID=UPI003CF9DE4B
MYRQYRRKDRMIGLQQGSHRIVCGSLRCYLLDEHFDGFPYISVSHILRPFCVGEIELRSDRAHKSPFDFGIALAVFLQCIELTVCVAIDVVGFAVSGPAAFGLNNPNFAIIELNDIVRVEVIPSEGSR